MIVLGPKEKEHGLSYVAFSRAIKFLNIGIEGGISGTRLTTQISSMKKLKLRLEEDDRLRHLAYEVLLYIKELERLDDLEEQRIAELEREEVDMSTSSNDR